MGISIYSIIRCNKLKLTVNCESPRCGLIKNKYNMGKKIIADTNTFCQLVVSSLSPQHYYKIFFLST